jgi:hypothetical protein
MHFDLTDLRLFAAMIEEGSITAGASRAGISGGAVIVDSPIRSPEEEARHPLERPPMGNKRVYETFDAALARFRLMPEQLCENHFIVEFIGRHSLRRAEEGWV